MIRSLFYVASLLALAMVLGGCSHLQKPSGHSQQVSVPGFAPGSTASDSFWKFWLNGWHRPHASDWQLRSTSNCRPLEGGFKPVFHCETGSGQFFVLQ